MDELRKPMARAKYDAEDLRHAQNEVEDLRNEEQHHCLCEMA